MILVDNKLKVAKYRLAYIVTFPIGILFFIFALYSNSPAKENVVSLAIGSLLLFIFVFMLIIDPQYIYISIVKNNKIIVRNYTAFPLFRNYKAFEIPINTFYDFEIQKQLGGLKKAFRITVASKKKIGKYPWISLSAVSKNEINTIISSLNKLVPADRRKSTL